MSKEEYIEAVNGIAFMVHEAGIDEDRWNHMVWVEHMETSPYFISFRQISNYGEIITILGDTFEYYNASIKIINGKCINGRYHQQITKD